MQGRVLESSARNPAAVTRRIEFREAERCVVETASMMSGASLVEGSYPRADEGRFRDLVRKGRYVGDIREHTVDGARILFLEDHRPVVLTTNPARVA